MHFERRAASQAAQASARPEKGRRSPANNAVALRYSLQLTIETSAAGNSPRKPPPAAPEPDPPAAPRTPAAPDRIQAPHSHKDDGPARAHTKSGSLHPARSRR